MSRCISIVFYPELEESGDKALTRSQILHVIEKHLGKYSYRVEDYDNSLDEVCVHVDFPEKRNVEEFLIRLHKCFTEGEGSLPAFVGNVEGDRND